MGEPLYRRTQHGITPTETGFLLLRCAERLEGVLEEAQALRNNTRGLMRGTMTILASHSNAESLLPLTIVALRDAHPGLTVRLSTMNSREAQRQKEAADLVFVEDAVASGDTAGGWIRETVLSTEILLLIPAEPATGCLSPCLLSEMDWNRVVWREAGSGIRENVLHALAQIGIHPEIRYELSGLAAIRDAVRCRLGVSFSSALATTTQQTGLEACAVMPRIPHTLSVMYRENAGGAVTVFLELLRPIAQNLQSEPPRVLRRLQYLREWSHEQVKQVFT